VKKWLLFLSILVLTTVCKSQDLGNFVNTGQVKLNCADQAHAVVFNWYWGEMLNVGEPWQVWGMVFDSAYSTCENAF
jgi:hypothetical protein